MATAKMKSLLPLVVWITLTTCIHSQGIGFGIQREIFFLNLEDGYFGCQLNDSTDVLQLYEVSKLCDGSPDCFKGSDELHKELKCTSDCAESTGVRCQNGACLESQCHCNDGFGGKGCEMPDENECKYRPCDVFAHCTNTMGSFFCTCFPGYTGDGFGCQDINECDDPVLAARCVENAECCNLPAHFVCKCLPGFEGDGEEECRDINECEAPGSCGVNAVCENFPGNYTCSCAEGYIGNPYDGCVDQDECENEHACGPHATCINDLGGHKCECPEGFQGDPYTDGCLDMDECSRSPCGRNALCNNMPGSYRCACPPGHVGDPFESCTDINECHQDGNATKLCGLNADCINTPGSYRCECPAGHTGLPEQECVDVNECGRPNSCGVNAKCINVPGSYKCLCPQGFSGQGHLFCENINECNNKPCGENAVCTDTVGSFLCTCKEDYTGDPFQGCVDINECVSLDKPCGTNAICENAVPGYNCLCPQGYAAKPNPAVACEQVDVGILCSSNFDCVNNAECIDQQCFCRDGFIAQGAVCEDVDECKNEPCGPYSICRNTPGSFYCECEQGFVGTPPRVMCKAPCEDVKCGPHAYCKPDGQEAYCMCEDGWTFNPGDISAGCVDIDECDKSNGPFGRCGTDATCTNTPGGFTCQCSPGYSGNAYKQCLDVDECNHPDACGAGAICSNTPGSYSCACPEGSIPDPDPQTKCVAVVRCNKDNDCPGNAVCDDQSRCLCPEPNIGNDCRHPCEKVFCGPNSECMVVNDDLNCVCTTGYTGTADPVQGCLDIDECAGNPCAQGAICNNEPGKFSCQCPSGFVGDPYRDGCKEVEVPYSCSPENPCPVGEQCIKDEFVGSSVCICQRGYTRDTNSGKCRDINECLEIREKPACGLNAMCKNLPGSYECQCPPGYNGNPFSLCEECNSLECQCQPPYQIVNGNCVLAGCSEKEACPPGAECITIAGGVSYCACPKGYRTTQDGSCEDVDECTEGRQVCGFGAECINRKGSYECKCPSGYSGDPFNGICSPDQIRCVTDADCSSNERCVQPGECVCPPPYFSDSSDRNRCKSPCERYPCGINAKCTPSDPPKCMCETGYQGNPLLGCTDIDECRDNPCAYGAHCLNEKGGFKCVCARGMVGDPYNAGCKGEGTPKTECVTSDDCANQLTCSDGSCVNPCTTLPCGVNAYCEAQDHAAWCRCLVGYTEGPTGECVSLCDGVRCGNGAQCIVTPEGPTCKCLEGFTGNPFPGGTCVPDVCSSATPCEEPRVCIGGRCKQRCEGIVCGIGASCDRSTSKCVCDPFFVGNPDLLCMPPYVPPSCDPGCGENAHCEYGLANRCVCNPGTSGNPYEGCGAQEKSCATTACGARAECRAGVNSFECVCPLGYTGNPYVGCEDVDECVGHACGDNAVCINTPGSYDCRCTEGYAGNPFEVCSPLGPGVCDDPLTCACGRDVPCPSGYTCEGGRCRDLCDEVRCGPHAVCSGGQCLCPPGFSGNPNDPNLGCKSGHCKNDLDCGQNEICFQYGKGVRKCVDGCSKLQCGPNALCITENHRSFCICQEGFAGNPADLSTGCQLEDVTGKGKCALDDDCQGALICQINLDGLRACINPCQSIACGQNEVCHIENGKPICACQDGHVWNPVSSVCEKPSLPDCTTDSDCPDVSACRPDDLGVLKCTPVCLEYTCSPNADCIASGHRGLCQCLHDYTGNPNDRTGCRPLRINQCSTDAECPESESCREENGALVCRPVCNYVRCGPQAVCVANNHVAQCQCPPGLYIGDPNDAQNGCKTVPCVYNIDCPPHQLCNRLDHTCYNVCDEEACGTNAVCIAENHKAQCSCPTGFKPNPLPEVECVPLEVCNPNPCHLSALCDVAPSGHSCRCPSGHVGDPYTTGCRPEGACPAGDRDCPPDAVCIAGRCSSPCDGACGPNAICTTENKRPVCTCPARFDPMPSPDKGCVRSSMSCGTDADCFGDVCINGQCKVICRDSNDCAFGERCMSNMCMLPCVGHSQCSAGQACVSGFCLLGCRSNRDCPREQACINSKCTDPCQRDGACGPNSLCRVITHTTNCYCPEGFEGNPVPQQGCVRVPLSCSTSDQCPKDHVCIGNMCTLPCGDNSECAVGERCANNMCVKVCYSDSNCLAGEVCVEGTCQPGCRTDSDCKATEICIGSKCRCGSGFISGPTGCRDVNECDEHPCHPSAECVNTPGSYKCSCPDGTVGDPFLDPGCVAPNECENDAACSDTLACTEGRGGILRCTDLCASTVCGPNAICNVFDHSPTCSCPAGYLGDANNANVGCFKVECIYDDDCSSDKYCDKQSNKCMNPCDQVNCGRGSCKAQNHQGLCTCFEGYQVSDGQCVDINECSQNPCHASAVCRNTPGSYVCTCPDGLIGDPFRAGCRKPGDCYTDSDCPATATCFNNRCKNPCEQEGSCGLNAECSPVAHSAVCRCPAQTRGDPHVRCVRLECDDSNDCKNHEACIDSKCVDPCSLPNVCGERANCVAINHVGVCSCEPGYTGDPHLGCVPVQYCNTDNQCLAGTRCTSGVCTLECTTARECLGDQLCIQSVCQPTCKSNDSCPDFQFCMNNICAQEVRCRSDDDCGNSEMCRQNSVGQTECHDACDGLILCGRNAECTPQNHQPVCSCKAGFYGNPQDERIGCQPIECQTSADCSNDKLCENYKCKIACLVNNPCGENALCSAENHEQTCYCQPGYTGDAYSHCDLIDFCADAPCGAGAHCDNARGSYKCYCPIGTVGDPYREGCQQPVECERNEDCPAAAECIKSNGVPKCKDVCESITCGPNTECVAQSHVGACACRNGYEGNPNDLIVGCRPKPLPCRQNSDCPQDTYCYGDICRPPCQSDEECGLTQTCLRGQCTNPCDAGAACGLNAECRMANHRKQCSCPAGFTGKGDVECVRIPVACYANNECPSDYTCKNGMCMPGCHSDSECALNEKCLKGNCILTCRVDNDCFLGHICLHNMCIIGCHSDEDCSASESCIQNRCVDPCEAASCGPNAVCSVNNQRATCSCQPGFIANPTPKVACVREPKPCTENRGCPDGSLCLGGICKPLCSSNANCLSNERCDAGVCKPLCRRDNDCRSGEICEGLICVIGCRSDPDCPTSQACVNSKCIDLCESPTACGTNAECRIVGHQKQCVCPARLIGDPYVSCRHAPTTCQTEHECAQDQTCYLGRCRSTCYNDLSCLSDERCLGGLCKPICNSDSKCDPGEICVDRVCDVGCRSDTVCPPEQACINNQCRNPCEGASACGSCAVCDVVNHAAQCSCPTNSVGNPLISCTQPASRCSESNVCAGGQQCLGGFCIKNCRTNSDCSCGESCSDGKCKSQCSNDNVCPQGQICQAGLCVIGCRTHNDCPNDRSCLNGLCTNPCAEPGFPCGTGAICRVSDHRAVCLCPDGFQGEPSQSCVKYECLHDEECETGKKCVEKSCRNPCLEANACGVNAQCRVVNRQAQCLCAPSYYGNPLIECKQDVDECLTYPCGENARCRDLVDGFECTCAPGCTGDPYNGCVCEEPQANLCQNKRCGVNAGCRVVGGHTAECYCPRNYPAGNPNVECTVERGPGDCRTLGCGRGAECLREGAVFVCRCQPGTVGTPEVECRPVIGCQHDSDCPEQQACINEKCQNPCSISSRCKAHQDCQVQNHQPVCVEVCQCQRSRDCPPGLICDGCNCTPEGKRPVTGCDHCPPGIPCDKLTGACISAPEVSPGCTNNDECPATESCINRQCVNPCSASNPCAANAECQVNNHRAQCRCPPGLSGDPFVNCYEVPSSQPECTADGDCANNKACINQLCQDPCVIRNPCGANAICKTNQHHPVCSCPDGWGGNPQVQCYKPECTSDGDCPFDKACINQNCLNPCTYGTIQCGRGAQCRVQAHQAQCFCPVGMQGDPAVSCVSVQCQYNEDCSDHEACDRLNRLCRPVCDQDTCAPSATCVGRNHQPQCNCPPGYSGNPFVECAGLKVPIEAEVECTQDPDCPSSQACINAHCQNPCAISQPCSPDQTCRVIDTAPLRTVMCQCPPDTVTDNNGQCRPIAQPRPECTLDGDCADTHKCVRGTCTEACRIDYCGINAQCKSQNHQAMCSCPPSFQGNPHIECTIPRIPSVPLPPECTKNDECPNTKACINQLCTNPCASGDPCGRGAFCHVEEHQPVCRCPAGYEGNPRTECRPPTPEVVGCASNTECPQQESCVNGHCVNPCNCGPNAECKVTNHYPICYCKPGYSGNPQIGCVKVGCQSDNECSSDKQCYNGECINPCILSDPCAANAECYAHAHRATCRCYSGYEGNPFDRCERIECHTNNDCPFDKACMEQRCINPCSQNSPCASNALCYVQSHAAGCRCPDHLPLGNPMSYCEKEPPVAEEPECRKDSDCASGLACIKEECVDPCKELLPCAATARCQVLDTVPIRTMMCICPEGWVPNNNGECRPVILPMPPGCTSDNECPSNETCINRLCRNPCDCGTNSLCHVENHRPVCSCKEGYEGNPNIACYTVGCRSDSECSSGRACVNGNCVSPCLVDDPCGPNAECYAVSTRSECRCLSGYQGNPYERCSIVGCRSNNDCPSDKACINSQCINPCVHDNPCAPRAECMVQNHLALCRCPPGNIGNPYIGCRPEPQPECRMDRDCPSQLACLEEKCQNPCTALEPCNSPSGCKVIGSLPVRTMICVCPPGYISSGSGMCKKIPAVTAGCASDSECPSEKACVNNVCRDPCNCGLNADCRIVNHKPVCTCQPGYDGNPEVGCAEIGCRSDNDCSGKHVCINRNCVPVCAPNNSSCGTDAICYGINHRAVCECPPGLVGNPKVACVTVGCRSDSECPSTRACINAQCVDPCVVRNPCHEPAECRVYGHQPDCSCPPGYVGDRGRGCIKVETTCRGDFDCPSQTACINDECVNPCNYTAPCGVNAECKVLDTVPVRTMICECLPGYQGNAAVQCEPIPSCPIEKGYVRDDHGNCICPPGSGLNENDYCIRCPVDKGLKVDERGRCVCALERGMIIDQRGRCICPTEHGYYLDFSGNCIKSEVPQPPEPECESDDQCPDYRYCNLETKTCQDPCATKRCGINALCNATNHQAVCQCISGYTGDPTEMCNGTSPFRTDFPRPDMVVSCLSDGVQVEIHIAEQGFNGVLYVKGHSKDEQCRSVVTMSQDSVPRVEVFKVKFGNCGLIHVNGQASFILVIQKHPKLVTYKAQAYHIKCVYNTGEKNVTLGFNVSMLTTAGTIANTGPPPTCIMKIVTHTGQEINQAEIGDNLLLRVDVQPANIYGGFSRSCIAKTMEDSVENEYIVTDADGCATDPTIFGEWEYDADSQALLASFNAFKFPSSDNIRFQCNIRVCFGKCQPVNCRGANAFGRRKREVDRRNSTDVNVQESIYEGQLREEITIQSNAILTIERREERFVDPTEAPTTTGAEDICVSMIGFIIALIITALLALVAVAVAVSCWLMAYRRQPKTSGPLPHPPEFPNPLFTTPEPLAEPSPDYLS